MVTGLAAGQIGYVRHAEIAALPATAANIRGDENFSAVSKSTDVRITGVFLQTLAQALDASPNSDLIDATCTDGYRAHYPASYISAHHPILTLEMNHLLTSVWAAQQHQQDPGPYFITHEDFTPSFKVLAHEDEPQVPTNVVRLNFSTTAATYGAIAPRGSFPPASPEQQGFIIARQNCLRCHNQGLYGGTKSGRNWTVLSTWAREQPAHFAGYVSNPKSYDPQASMPPNPEYDAATLTALTAYFTTFTTPSVPARQSGRSSAR